MPQSTLRHCSRNHKGPCVQQFDNTWRLIHFLEPLWKHSCPKSLRPSWSTSREQQQRLITSGLLALSGAFLFVHGPGKFRKVSCLPSYSSLPRPMHVLGCWTVAAWPSVPDCCLVRMEQVEHRYIEQPVQIDTYSTSKKSLCGQHDRLI